MFLPRYANLLPFCMVVKHRSEFDNPNRYHLDYHVVLRIALILKSARLCEINKIFDDAIGVARSARNRRDLGEQLEKIRILIVSRYIKHIIASLSINILAFYHKKREFSSVSLTFSPESCTIKEKTEKREGNGKHKPN